MHFIIRLSCMLLAISSIHSLGNVKEIIETEVAEAIITFRCTSESPVPFSLAIGGRDPFFEEGQLILDNLTPSQQSRFQVFASHSRAQQYTLVQIVIKNVQKTDGGSYTCRFYGTEVVSPVLKEIALTVNYPPGEAQCSNVPSNRDGYDEIHCAARGGSPPGFIECKAYHANKDEAEPNKISQNETHILYVFVVGHDTTVHCCAKNEVNENDPICTDFVLERKGLSSEEKSTVIPSYGEVGESSTTESLYSTGVLNTTKNNTHVSPHSNLKIILPIVILVLIIIIMVIKLVKKCTRSGRGEKVPAEEVSLELTKLPDTTPNKEGSLKFVRPDEKREQDEINAD